MSLIWSITGSSIFGSLLFSSSTGAGHVILRFLRPSVFLQGNSMCTTFIELECFFLHHEQTGPPAHVCLQVYMEKNIGITMVAQVCVLTLFPCSFQDLVALMSQKTGTLVPLQDDEKKLLLRRQLGGFRDECHKQILADNLEIWSNGYKKIKRNVSLLTGGFFIMWSMKKYALWKKTHTCWRFTGWWFRTFFIFTPTWGNDPIWLIFFNWMGWNHQLVNIGWY